MSREKTTDVYIDEHTIGTGGGFFDDHDQFGIDPRVRDVMANAEQAYREAR